jgi:hypothetical protein
MTSFVYISSSSDFETVGRQTVKRRGMEREIIG